jgi:hypothetical protein
MVVGGATHNLDGSGDSFTDGIFTLFWADGAQWVISGPWGIPANALGPMDHSNPVGHYENSGGAISADITGPCVPESFPSADCFTGVYVLGSISFPMYKWADGDYRGSNGDLYWSYENSRWQMSNGYGDGMIYVGPSTKSSPVGFYPGGFMDSYNVTGPC